MPENIDNQEDPKRDMHVTTYEGEKNKPDLQSNLENVSQEIVFNNHGRR